MKWFNNIKIGKRLFIMFSIIIILVTCFGIFTYFSLSQMHAKTSEMDSKWLLGVTYSNEANTMSSDFRILELQHIQSKDQAEMAGLEKEMDSKNSEINNVLSKYVLSSFEEDKNLFDTAKTKWENYIEIHKEIISLSRQLKNDEAMALIKGRGKEAFDSASNALTALAQYNEKNSARLAEETKNLYNSTVIILIIVLMIMIAISVFSGVFLVNSIVNPLKIMVDAAEKIADGDLNVKMDLEQKDEIGILLNALNRIIESLHRLTTDANMLSSAAVEGKLDTRADASKHHGDYRKIVEGVNDTLDAVILPITEAEHVMKTMSLNDYTIEVKGQYKGLLKEFAGSINDVRARLLSVQDAMVRISKGDTSRLEEFLKIGKRSENDMLMPAVSGMMQTIQHLINEAVKLANSAVNGEMHVRGNADAFEGGYREIITGMNKTMDAVSQPLNEAATVLSEMEKGNLTVSMNGEYKGEYAKVKEAINFTSQTFNNILNDINTAAQQVAAGSRQVSDSAQALSQGSTEQASSVEELTASLEEISVQTKHNATNANQANELAITAKDNAIRGNEQMSEMLKAMEEINESSSNISKIIKVIDDIAFQTNILALNAAVEAARAGQHGKGFAVVAEEVRNLAARSANAAKETTGLIEGSIRKAEGGTKIANETANALNKIVDGITKAAELVGGIATASDEQASAISQINQGIMQVSQVTQTNSATSQESAAASEELSSQAEVLNEMVGKFKLRKNNTLKSLDELNPDVIRMLENITERKMVSAANEKKSDTFPSRMKIALSDREFGKY